MILKNSITINISRKLAVKKYKSIDKYIKTHNKRVLLNLDTIKFLAKHGY